MVGEFGGERGRAQARAEYEQGGVRGYWIDDSEDEVAREWGLI